MDLICQLLFLRVLNYLQRLINNSMKLIKYADLKHGEHYIVYYSESSEKEIAIFELNDKAPLPNSFTIIIVKHLWLVDEYNNVLYSCDSPDILLPTASSIYSLTETEFETQVLIPAI